MDGWKKEKRKRVKMEIDGEKIQKMEKWMIRYGYVRGREGKRKKEG